MSASVTITNDNRGFSAWIRSLAVEGSSMDRRTRRRVYLQVAALSLLLIWGPVIAFLVLAPVSYTSRWSLILPGAGTGTAVNLESIGQASAMATSPFSSNSVDPKVNYKSIATSAPVLAEAARKLDMEPAAFGKPAIKLVDQTALIDFRVTGSTGAEAHAKSIALYEALENQVTRLREDEILRRESAVRKTLESFSDTLARTQERLLAFQSGADIVSIEQFREMTVAVERLREQHSAKKAALQGVRAQLELLSAQYGLAPSIVRVAMRLQQDEVFQELLKERSRLAATRAEQRAKWGSQHYELKATEARYRGLTQSLKRRVSQISPQTRLSVEELSVIGSRSAQEAPVRSVIELSTQEAGLRAEVATLEAQVEARLARLETGSSDAVTLEDLTRKQQVAMAVFTTALARTDLGKSDIYASYPMIQMLARPTEPGRPDLLGRILALAGGIAGSLFCLTGLWLLWIRKNLLQKILKSA